MGWISHLDYFWERPSASFLHRLASFSRLIIFDKRSTGLSDRAAGLPTIEQRIDDVRAVIVSLGPIALGHALAIVVVVGCVALAGSFIPTSLLLIISGLVLIPFAAYKVASNFRHPRWVGMRVSNRELVMWSFIMATAHGAGLMLIPIVLRIRNGEVPSALAAGHHHHHVESTSEPLGIMLASVGIHSLAMIVTSFILAVAVYTLAGVNFLRKAWINLDWIWAGALSVTGMITLGMGVLELTS